MCANQKPQNRQNNSDFRVSRRLKRLNFLTRQPLAVRHLPSTVAPRCQQHNTMDFIPYRRQWRLKTLVTALLLVFLGSALAWTPSTSRQKVLLSQVETLTLFSDRVTEYRRTVKSLDFSRLTIGTSSAIKVCGWGCDEVWISS
jgi:hypothetical protein